MTNENKVKHLFWRAGFGLNANEWLRYRNKPIEDIVDQLFSTAKKDQRISLKGGDHSFRKKERKNLPKGTKKMLKKESKKLVIMQGVEWVKRMGSESYSPLLERMTLFWHGHFACRIKRGDQAYGYMKTLRKHALGDFKSLVLAVAKEPAMIKYLNNQQNRKKSPNENFARELMELFTIGTGNYSEQDIKESARAFTGWSSIDNEFVFKERQHDFDSKTFMGRTGKFDGEDIIDIILEQKATAHFICKKIYKYFVNSKVNEGIVEELAQSFFASGYNIEQLMRKIFTADWFYQEENLGVKIKSPVELTAGLIRNLDVKFESFFGILFIQKALGQVLFNPPNVAGWPGGKSWIDNSTLMLRLNLTEYLFKNSTINMTLKATAEEEDFQSKGKKFSALLNLAQLKRIAGTGSDQAIVGRLADFLLINDLKIREDFFLNYTEGHSIGLIQELTLRLTSLPEYQFC